MSDEETTTANVTPISAHVQPAPTAISLAPEQVMALLKHDFLRGWLASERDRLQVLAQHYAEQAAKIEGELTAFVQAHCPSGGTLDLAHGVIVPNAPTSGEGNGNTQTGQGA